MSNYGTHFGIIKKIKDFTSATGNARAIDTLFTPNTNSGVFVSYTPRLSASVTSTLTGSATSTAQCDLQIRPTPGSGGFTTIASARLVNTSNFTLLIGISITDTKTQDHCLSGFIPAGYEVRLTTTTSGTASVSMTSQPQQETTFS